MKKLNLFLILSFVLVISTIVFYVNRSPISRISQRQYNNIQYDNYTNSLWASYIFEDKLYIISKITSSDNFDFEQPKIVDTPEKEKILSFCIVENFVWVAITDKPTTQTGAIYIYDKSNETLNKFLDFNVTDCKVIQDEVTVFWGENKVLIIDKNKQVREIEISGIVYDVAQDNEGSIWVANEYGEIYKDEENTTVLVLSEEPKTKMFFDANNNLWIINEKFIFLDANSDLLNPQVLRSNLQDHLYSAFEDNQNRVWLILRKNILRYENGELIDIDTPPNAINFRFGGVDWNNQLAFVGSSRGIYEIDLTSK